MNKTTRLIITAAALSGLYAGSLASRAYAADEQAGTTEHKDHKKDMSKDKSSCSGKDGFSSKESCTAKQSCKGLNSCKGQGGCSSGDNGCKGKNSCKGKGGCGASMDKDAKKGK
jgi:hypothetical protein